MRAVEPFPLLPPPSRFLQPPSSPGHQVVLGLGHVGVVRPPQGPVNAQGPGVVLLHLLELALVLAQQGQVAQLLGHVWMKLAQNLGQEREPVAGLGAGLHPPSAQPTWPAQPCLLPPSPGSPVPACRGAQPPCTCPACHTGPPGCSVSQPPRGWENGGSMTRDLGAAGGRGSPHLPPSLTHGWVVLAQRLLADGQGIIEQVGSLLVLVLVPGGRWEHDEGYPPAQGPPPSGPRPLWSLFLCLLMTEHDGV